MPIGVQEVKSLLKYFIWLLSFLTLVSYYFLGTRLGHLSLGKFSEAYLSQKFNNKIEILALNLESYPFVTAKLRVNDTAMLLLKGNTQEEHINLHYHLTAQHFKWNKYSTNKPLDLKGTIRGKRSELLIKGKGNAFEGRTDYFFTKKPHTIESMNIAFSKINAEEFLRFLHMKTKLKGKIDLNITQGYYNKSTALMSSNYRLKAYHYGGFSSTGQMKYEHKSFSFKGKSTSYRGVINYDYVNKKLEAKLKEVSLQKLLKQFSFPQLLQAKLYGVITYDSKEKVVFFNTQLKEARFRRTNLTALLKKVTGMDLLQDVYDKSIFIGQYQASVLTAVLQLEDGTNHLYLNEIHMYAKTNRVNANFNILIHQQELIGKIGGTLQDPKVNLDISRLLQYQIQKKSKSFLKRFF